jgi:FkbM family methyltransferase
VPETLVDTPSWLLHTNGGLALHVPADLSSQTTCSLLELEQWHEPDIQFLSKLLAPDAIALDAGADHGMYAVALGRHLGKGRVWALEPDACALRRLQCSVQANGLQERVALLAVHLTGPGASGDRQDTLDGFAARHLAGCPIDLVRMGDRAPVAAILDGGQQVIATDRPILLLAGRSVRPGQAVSQRLAALGYGLFSYLPELEVLAPVDLLSADDLGERPCWAVALERITELARRGLLADVDAVLRAPNPPVLEQAVAPYLVALQRTITGHTERERSAADRVALLMAARDDLQAALNAGDESGPEAWALLVHLLQALGQRANAVNLAKELLKQWDASVPVSRPVMPPRREDLDQPRTQPDAGWLRLRLAEFIEAGQPWAPWSTAPAASRLAALTALTAQPDHRPAMARRQLLAHLRRDESLPVSLLHVVAHHSGTVNSELWRAVALQSSAQASADTANTAATEPVTAAPATAAQRVQSATQHLVQLLSDHPGLAGEFERLAALAQGKGSGAFTSAHEVRMALAFCGAEPRLAIDVGAHQGDYAAELRRWQPSLEIHLFEPSSAHRQTLANRFAQAGGVVQVPAALAAQSGAATLYADRPGSGLASLTRRQLGHLGITFNSTESVQTLRFEDYWKRQLRGRPIDLVKIDVEGHELQVLQGFGAALACTRVVQFEFGGTHIDTRTFFRDFWFFFSERGFDLYRQAPCGPVPVPAYREADEAFVVTNYLAVRRLR